MNNFGSLLLTIAEDSQWCRWYVFNTAEYSK